METDITQCSGKVVVGERFAEDAPSPKAAENHPGKVLFDRPQHAVLTRGPRSALAHGSVSSLPCTVAQTQPTQTNLATNVMRESANG